MFNPKPYLEVNREERFFCALLVHALLTSRTIRTNFASLIKSRYGMILDPESFDVFLEAAALRDYWKDLGDPVEYNSETHSRRRTVLGRILRHRGIPDPESVIDTHDFFWTSPEHRKLWSPGRWNPKAVKEARLERLVKVKWAFNAKPDILIVSGSKALVVEGKLESGLGKNRDSGYQQLDIQDLITRLLNLLVPSFKDTKFQSVLLTLNSSGGVSWKEVLGLVDEDSLDPFSRKCLRQLERFYPG